MKFHLDETLLQKSEPLKHLLSYLQEQTGIVIETKQLINGRVYTVLSLPDNITSRHRHEEFELASLEKTQITLVEDFFNEKILLSSDKDKAVLKAQYAAYINSSRLTKKFGIMSLELPKIDDSDADKEKDDQQVVNNLLDTFGSYLEEKEKKIVKVSEVLGEFAGKGGGSLKEVLEGLEVVKVRNEQLQVEINSEKMKTEYYVGTIGDKVEKVIEALKAAAKFKGEEQLTNEAMELVYQKRLLDNLKLHRKVVEGRLQDDLYDSEQQEALRVIRESLEKKVNLLLSNKKYVDERAKQAEKRAEEDFEFADVLARIVETNKAIKRKEDQLRRIKELVKNNKPEIATE